MINDKTNFLINGIFIATEYAIYDPIRNDYHYIVDALNNNKDVFSVMDNVRDAYIYDDAADEDDISETQLSLNINLKSNEEYYAKQGSSSSKKFLDIF